MQVLARLKRHIFFHTFPFVKEGSDSTRAIWGFREGFSGLELGRVLRRNTISFGGTTEVRRLPTGTLVTVRIPTG